MLSRALRKANLLRSYVKTGIWSGKPSKLDRRERSNRQTGGLLQPRQSLSVSEDLLNQVHWQYVFSLF